MSVNQKVWMTNNPEYKDDGNMEGKLRGSEKESAVSLNIQYIENNILFLPSYISEVEMVPTSSTLEH